MRRRLRYVGVGAVVFLLAMVIGFFAIPVPRLDPPTSTVLLDRDGRLLGATTATDQQWRFPPIEDVPPRYAAAVLQYEDKRFYWHPGVDPLSVGRAIQQNLRAGHVESGASTLTMQVVRMSRGNPSRTVPEKALEAVLALRLDAAMDKDAILAAYANNAPFGGNTVGIEAASWRYFGHGPTDLSWGEAAALAVLPNSPSLVRPGRNAERLREKRDALLDDLAAAGALSVEDATLAKAEALPGVPRPVPQLAPHLLAASHGRVHTTLDARLQERATAAVMRQHEALEANGIHNAAAVALDVETGEVLVWVGNVTPEGEGEHGEYVDVVTAARSTGSTLKPFLYMAMVQDGEMMPKQLIPDVPIRLGSWAPENYDRAYDGAVPANLALSRSRNVPAVWMLRTYGVPRFYGFLRRLGMSTLWRPAEDYGLTLALGGAEGTLLDLTSQYRLVAWTLDHAGAPDDGYRAAHWRGTVEAGPPPGHLDPAAAWLTVEALIEVNRPGTEGAWRAYANRRQIAWKTGTSFGFRDGWAIGITPRIAVGVWVGNADGEGRPGLTGYQAAAPLLFELFDLFDRQDTGGWFRQPDADLVSVRVCAHSGMRAGPNCAETRMDLAPRRAKEGPPCPYCEQVACDEGCEHRVTASCASVADIEPTPFFVLPPAMEHFFRTRHPTYVPLPPYADGCADPEAGSALAVINPRENAEIYVPIELSGERGRVVFEAAHRDRDVPIYWHLDEEYVGTTRDKHQLGLAPDAGEHVLTLVDGDGARLERHFTVLDPRGDSLNARR